MCCPTEEAVQRQNPFLGRSMCLELPRDPCPSPETPTRPPQSRCPALEHHESCAPRELIPCSTPGCVLCSVPAAAAAVGAVVHAGLAGRQLDQLVPLLLPLLLRVNQARLKNGKENPKILQVELFQLLQHWFIPTAQLSSMGLCKNNQHILHHVLESASQCSSKLPLSI